MKQALFVFALFVSAVSFSQTKPGTTTTPTAQTKIGHVNSQVLLDTLPSRKVAMDKLKVFQEEGYKELQEMQKSFEAAYQAYLLKEKDLSPMMQQIEKEKLMKKQQAIEERQEQLERELQIYSDELNRPILDRVQKAVEIVADRKKLSYVIDEGSTLYFKGGIDCTAEVIVELLKLDAEATKTK